MLTVDHETENNDEPSLTGSYGRGGNRFNKLARHACARPPRIQSAKLRTPNTVPTATAIGQA